LRYNLLFMRQKNFISYLLNPKNWWLPLLVIFTISVVGVTMIGIHTYTEAPPLPDYTTSRGNKVFTNEDILQGQAVFQKYALMEYGSMFGDGANRGPDFTAEGLHQVTVYMNQFYASGLKGSSNDNLLKQGMEQQVKKEIKSNRYDASTNTVLLSDAQSYAATQLVNYYTAKFTDPTTPGAFRPAGYLSNVAEIRSFTAFVFWGAWVCGVERPGKTYSYTHNWPFDPQAGNTSSAAIVLWSIIGSLGLIIGLGLVLYYHGRMDKLDDNAFVNRSSTFMSRKEVQRFRPDAIQRSTFKFFYTAIVLFTVQVLSGILTVHDFVGFVKFFGWDISTVLPVTITRSWHVQLSLLWISACWVGASIFVMPLISKVQPKRQLLLVNLVFWLLIATVAGSMAGIFMGPHGLLANWYWLGHQGWEYVELGKLWQVLLAAALVIWVVLLYRGIRPVMKWNQPWALPNWMVYTTASILLLLISGFIATPKTNFVIADFWRWCVIHMWAEAFFEVFTTVLIGYFMVLMGLVSRQATIRVIYLATLLFLGSGLLGISHNFYWNAKPVGTMALGSVFSTLQVIPLVLLTLEAWRFSKIPGLLEKNSGAVTSPEQFGFKEVFLFLIGVNFWNFFGAGVLGFIINLPIANYYEHGTYLTVNHGHAALMGVYGNLALAAVLFCCQLLCKSWWWKPKTVRMIFWSINVGLILMVFLDLFPVGIWQFQTVTEKGFWFARSSSFIESKGFQTFTWLRIIGGALFTLGGVFPLLWLMIKGSTKVKRNIPALEKLKAGNELVNEAIY
jgi:nitric oxide reductase subunit B